MVATPAVPAAPAIPATETAPVTGGAETAMQEVAPGVRLPAPRAGAASPLAGLLGAGGDVPRVDTSAADRETLALVPVEPGVTTPPAARAAAPITGDEGPSPAPAADRADSPVVAPSQTTAAPASIPAAPSAVAATPAIATPVMPEDSAVPAEPGPLTLSNPARLLPVPQAAPAPAASPDDPTGLPTRVSPVTVEPVTEETAPVEPAVEPEERLALAPVTEPSPQSAAEAPAADAGGTGAAGESELVLPADALQPPEPGSGTSVESRIASVDPTAEGPTLANARWVGFTPAVFTGSDTRPGAWIAGPFDRKERTGWITDTATGATTRVTFLWREGGRGSRTATLSQDAARALGLGQGDVANVAVYLPR